MWARRRERDDAMSDVEADMPAGKMWTLSEDRETVRLQLPPLPIAGMPEPQQA
jgi:hypothetical protein